jgi:hypothetical protein
MDKGKIIGMAVGYALVAMIPALSLGNAISNASAATTGAAAKCPDYEQLTGGGGEDAFSDIRGSGVSCKIALTVLEVFANNPPGRLIEGFKCARHPKGKSFTANCVKRSKTVAFSYAVFKGGSGKLVHPAG